MLKAVLCLDSLRFLMGLVINFLEAVCSYLRSSVIALCYLQGTDWKFDSINKHSIHDGVVATHSEKRMMKLDDSELLCYSSDSRRRVTHSTSVSGRPGSFITNH